MSSAAKLRYIGRGTAVVASAALVMTSFGPAAFAAWDDIPATAAVEANGSAGNNGTIGVVDTDTTAVDNQGATIVSPGQDGQEVGDVRFTIPNRFISGDVIELRVLDRTATRGSDGSANTGPDYKVGFSAAPQVNVSEPMATDTLVAGDTDAPTTGTPAGSKAANTETDPGSPWVAAGPAGSATATKPASTPQFNVQRLQGANKQGYDILRLTHVGGPASGDPNAKWVVTLSDLKVDLGSKVAPGALRVVPFAISKAVAGSTYSNSDWFYGNRTANDLVSGSDATAVTPANRSIGVYTVPAFVAPAVFSVANPSIIADGSSQGVGDIKIAESNPSSLGNGTYTLTIAGARIANTDLANQVKVAVTGGGANETVSLGASSYNAATNTSTITYTVSGADDTKSSTFTLTGLQLSRPANSTGRISYTLTGGTIASFIPGPGAFAGSGGASGQVPAEAAFCGVVNNDANATARTVTTPAQPVTVTAPAQALTGTMTGTAPLAAGSYTVAGAPGSAQTLNINSTVVANSAAGNGVFTLAAPFAGSLTLAPTGGSVTAPAAASTVTVAQPTPSYTGTGGFGAAPTATGTQLADGTYTLRTGTTNLDVLGPDGVTLIGNMVAATGVITLVAPYSGTATITPGGTGAGTPAAGDAFTIASTETVAATSATAPTQNQVTVVNPGTTPELAPSTTYYIVQDTTNTNLWYLNDTNNATTPIATSTDGVTFQGANGVSVVLAQRATTGSTFTVGAAGSSSGICINQDDILAPQTSLLVTGSATSGPNAIGGTNRFGTAARIASEFVKSTGRPTADTAIIVNGIQAPDALSSSFLSQREGAPILLTAPGQLPAETVEALRDLGVRKVYIVGGRTAVGSAVFDALKNQNAYMWDDAAKAIKPRGDKLEVVQLGGDNRYQTNWRVNTYAAAQTAGNAPVGKIAVGYGQALKTTAMVARSSTSNDFVDALSASVLSAGRAGGLEEQRGAGVAQTLTVSTGAFQLLNAADATKIPVGRYVLNGSAAGGDIMLGTAVAGTWTPNALTFTGSPAIPLAGVAANGDVFTVAANQDAGAIFGYDTTSAKTNALPVILTQPTTLVPEAASQMRALHIEHTLLIGSDAALAKKVNDDIAAVGPTSYRIEGKDRWETAANVNRFAMAPEAVTATGQVPGLGFDGSHVYSDNARTNRVGGEMVTYLANGMKFPDALVAGPWVSRTRNSMVMTLQNDLPEPTAVFISEKAAQLDRAAGLGQGAAVSSGVIVEANQIASSK